MDGTRDMWPQSNKEWVVELWNRLYPPGTPVRVWSLGIKPFKTRTTSSAELLNKRPSNLVIKVEGYSEWFDLRYCLPLEEETEESHDVEVKVEECNDE